LPAPVEPVHLLALLTRVRAQRVAAGELAGERLYDVRAFKCAYAELGYLRRLAAAGGAGGTVVTSMRQLVAGLAALHPAWQMTGGEGFEDRDRHHRAVRRRLDALQAMGLLRWRIGTDLDGEERRTELELRSAPQVSAEELQAAARHLQAWQARYGPALNTGSKTGIRNAAGHGRPLSAAERQRRGRQRGRAVAAGRCRRGSQSNSTPPFGASATPKNNDTTTEALEVRSALQRTGVTRTDPAGATSQPAAPAGLKTAVTEGSGAGPVEQPARSSASGADPPAGGQDVVWDPAAVVARVAARETQRRPVLDAIATQATERALEVCGWGLQRAWPVWRLREAWVVARWGAPAAADSGPTRAGPLYPDDYARLRRAVARYQRNHTAAPDGYPATGLGALLHLGTLAGSGALAGGPRALRYAVGALDQLSRRMRAVATADSATRAQHATDRAHRRREPPPRALGLAFRATWPPWVATDEHGKPVFDRLGMLALDPDARGGVPPVDSDSYRMIVRDAYLLAGRQLPIDVDGRKQMALRHQRQLDPAARRRAPTEQQRELSELAHRTGQPTSQLARLSPTYRQTWLAQLRAEDAQRARAEIIAFKHKLANITPDADRR